VTLVSIVVPVYYSSATLGALLSRLRAVADSLPDLAFEYVMVDDGSGDHSFALLQAEAAADPRVRAMRLSRNFGSNAAILAGLTYARGDCCVVIAADLQDPPELIPDLIREWQAGADIVLAARRSRDDPLVSRLFASAFNRLFRRLVFPDFPPNGFDFLLASQRVARQLVAMNERNSYIFGQIMWVGYDRRIVYYDRAAREEGSSRWTVAKKVKYLIDAFTAFSYLPVRAATLLGVVLGLGGFVWALVVIAARLLGWIPETGFAAIMVALLVLSGTQLVVSGLIGEYLWRVLEESRNRPAFLVAQTVNVEVAADGVGVPADTRVNSTDGRSPLAGSAATTAPEAVARTPEAGRSR
jgi:dolichol-phosphate mannosyltransferase